MTDNLTPTQAVAAPVGFRLRQLWILFAIFIAPVLFVPAIVGIWSLVPRRARGWRLCLAGGVVFAAGTWCNGLSEAVLGTRLTRRLPLTRKRGARWCWPWTNWV